jgi:hypothetical protein
MFIVEHLFFRAVEKAGNQAHRGHFPDDASVPNKSAIFVLINSLINDTSVRSFCEYVATV